MFYAFYILTINDKVNKDLFYGGSILKNRIITVLIILLLSVAGCNPQEYEVKIELAPEEAGEVVGQGTYEAGEEIELAAIPNEGYGFENWTTDEEVISEDQSFKITVDESKNIKANFNKLKEDIYATFKIKEGREIVLVPFTEKEKINLSAKEEVLHEFIRWEVDGKTVSEEKELEYILGDEDLYIEAVYKTVEKEIDEKNRIIKDKCF